MWLFLRGNRQPFQVSKARYKSQCSLLSHTSGSQTRIVLLVYFPTVLKSRGYL